MPFDLGSLAVSDLEDLLATKARVVPALRSRRKAGGRYSPGNEGWVSVPGGTEVRLARSRPFTQWEASILEPYGDALSDLFNVPEAIARSAAFDVLPRAIAVQVGGDRSSTVENAIRYLLRAATSKYEGNALSVNLLLDLSVSAESPALNSLDEYEDEDWHAVLGTGSSTAIHMDAHGKIIELIDLAQLEGAPIPAPEALSPDALKTIGAWTTEPYRVAASLTRGGEILVQQSGSLRYVYRSGRWKSLPLDNASSLGWCHAARLPPALKSTVLATAIDASLAHHGACIAIVAPGHFKHFIDSEVVNASDRWPNSRSAMFGDSTFYDLSRRQRVELLSMDGATILDKRGTILAAGAIVKVPGGSTGGGRLAATKALAQYGAALKVSQDGPIRLFGLDRSGDVVEKLTLG
jgi:hypothetical protein